MNTDSYAPVAAEFVLPCGTPDLRCLWVPEHALADFGRIRCEIDALACGMPWDSASLTTRLDAPENIRPLHERPIPAVQEIRDLALQYDWEVTSPTRPLEPWTYARGRRMHQRLLWVRYGTPGAVIYACAADAAAPPIGRRDWVRRYLIAHGKKDR